MTKILVVEDNFVNMELVVFLLESNGMEVTSAFDGREALEILKDSCFDIILLDILLPGIDGMAVLKYIKENPALQHIPVVALTALAMQGDEQRLIGAGCIGYISKPIDISQFLTTVNFYLNKGINHANTQ